MKLASLNPDSAKIQRQQPLISNKRGNIQDEVHQFSPLIQPHSPSYSTIQGKEIQQIRSLSSDELLSEIELVLSNCKDDANITNFVDLARLLHQYPEENFLFKCFFCHCSNPIIDEAKERLEQFIKQLNLESLDNLENLIFSYGQLRRVTEFLYSEGIYTGDVLNGIPHGQGIFIFHNGKTLEGNFINGQLQEEETKRIIVNIDEDEELEKAERNDKQGIKVRKRRAFSLPGKKSIFVVVTPLKDQSRKQIEVNLEEAVLRSTQKVLLSDKVEEGLKEIIELGEASYNLLEKDSSAASELILSGKKLGLAVSLVTQNLENPFETSGGACKPLITDLHSDSEWGSFASDEDSMSSSHSEMCYVEDQKRKESSSIECIRRSKNHEEFLFDEKVYGQIVNLRVVKNSIEALRKINNNSAFEEGYTNATNKIEELMKSSIIAKNNDQLLNLFAKFPLDELLILQNIKNSMASDSSSTNASADFFREYTESALEKRKNFLEEIDGWKRVFALYLSTFDLILEKKIHSLKNGESCFNNYDPEIKAISEKFRLLGGYGFPYSPTKLKGSFL